MVLVITPAAMLSPITRKEWQYARQEGVCVYPVKGAADSDLDYKDLPRWMAKVHFRDPAQEWDQLIRDLRSPGQAPRVPFMAPDLPNHYVERPTEFAALRKLLVEEDRSDPVAITTALTGAGGFGKTTLAIALCHDDDVITAFDDGILWVTLGQEPDVLTSLRKFYRALTGKSDTFLDIEDAQLALRRQLADKSCLLVVDDVWHRAYLDPFLEGGPHCARLITTRRSDAVPDAA
ncbi:MAG: hypothetical protein JRE64_22410 [Deltaproteobacteria bacterium]|nr:hypothetical protein [Deltaproteobacteria bacterium]